MANFCGKCGSPIDQTTGLCPNCSPQTAAHSPETAPATIPAPVISDTDKTNDNNPKPKKKLIRIVAIVLAALILIGGGIIGFMLLSKDRGYPVAGKGYLVSNKHGIFYTSGVGTINLEDIEAGRVYDQDGDWFYLDRKTAVGKDKVYSMPGNELSIYEIEFEDENEVNREIWMEQEELYDAFSELFGEAPFNTMWNWQYSDGYIYFTIYRDLQYTAEYPDYAENAVYRICRINIKDKSVELLDSDIHATSYVVDGNWIYYSENGYSYNNGNISYDMNEAGIYKMKLDGSKKEKLLDVDASDEDWENFRDMACFTNLSVFKGKLYFIDNSEPRDNRLCRMKTNGKNVEEVSSECAHEYTIDTKRNKLYYISGPRTADNRIPSQDFVEVNLKNLKEDTIATFCKGGTHFFDIICHDSKLYFYSFDKQFFAAHNSERTKEDPALVGLYYDLKKEEATGIYMYNTYRTVTQNTPAGPREEKVMEDTFFYTEEYENNDKFIEFKN